MTTFHPGTVVKLRDLTSRTDLNDQVALLTSKVLDSGRQEAFVLLDDNSNRRPEGINVFEKNFAVVADDAPERASAWNELGTRFLNTGNHVNALDAFECGLAVASDNTETCRIEGCDSLCLMAWLGLRMNNEGLEFEGRGERTTSSLVDFSLKHIFSEVLESDAVVHETSKVNMGAGRVPAREHPVLMLSVQTDDTSRYFFYDEIEKVVHECVEKKIDASIPKRDDDDGGADDAVPAIGPTDVPEASSRGQADVCGQE